MAIEIEAIVSMALRTQDTLLEALFTNIVICGFLLFLC